eukprot:CAMPEP_0172807312 /NCGR_PEP_ID=MMETSP1075-20121228/6923_1 /TAXON_ID=2916 /ORGANISM="Ceratium fusus, Strain PA161109" /LENGTH=260 /DNA_ID=CAMNT_0013646277 /DNA_START=64 /DNA_END=842 /DNA_ORIENTATION=-
MVFRISGFLAFLVCIAATLAEPNAIQQEIADDVHSSANADEIAEHEALLQESEDLDDSQEESSLEAEDDSELEEGMVAHDLKEMQALEQDEEEEDNDEEEEEDVVEEEEESEDDVEETAELEKAEKKYEGDVTSALQTNVVLADVHQHDAAEEYLQAKKPAALLEQGEEAQASEGQQIVMNIQEGAGEDMVEEMEHAVGEEDEEGEKVDQAKGDWTEAMMQDVDEIDEDERDPTMPLTPRGQRQLRPDDLTSALQASIKV